MPGDRALGDRVVAERVEVDVGQRREDLDRARALDRDERRRERPVVEDRPEAREPLGQRVAHDLGVAGVGDDEEALRPEPVDDQVVDDRRRPARRSSSTGRGPSARAGGFVTSAEASASPASGALDEQLAHVRQVEQAGPLADRAVLLEDPGVLDGHQPAAELDQPRAERRVAVAERRLVEPARRRRSRSRPARVARPARAATEPAAGDGVAGRAIDDLRGPGDEGRARSRRSAACAASSNATQRTCSNSWSWRARSPPIGSIRK